MQARRQDAHRHENGEHQRRVSRTLPHPEPQLQLLEVVTGVLELALAREPQDLFGAGDVLRATVTLAEHDPKHRAGLQPLTVAGALKVLPGLGELLLHTDPLQVEHPQVVAPLDGTSVTRLGRHRHRRLPFAVDVVELALTGAAEHVARLARLREERGGLLLALVDTEPCHVEGAQLDTAALLSPITGGLEEMRGRLGVAGADPPLEQGTAQRDTHLELTALAGGSILGQGIFLLLRGERIRIANRYESEGREREAKILGQMTKDLEEIASEGYRDAVKIRGGADAEVLKIYAEAYSRDSDFYSFSRSMEVFPEAFGKGTQLVLDAEQSELLKYIKGHGSAPSGNRPKLVPAAR